MGRWVAVNRAAYGWGEDQGGSGDGVAMGDGVGEARAAE